MNVYALLVVAIAFEVLGTMLLPASENFTKPWPSLVLVASYAVSFYLLADLSQRLPLSIVYASWSGMGVFSVALLSYFFYAQKLNWQTIVGLVLIVVGVAVVNVYKEDAPPNDVPTTERAQNPG